MVTLCGRAPTCSVMRLHRRQLFAVVAALLPGCREPAGLRIETTASPSPRPGAGGYASVRLEGIPHVRQKPDFCGEAVAAAYLTRLGARWTQDDVFAVTGMDPARGMGATTRELKAALERIGLEVGPVWHQVPADDGPALEALWAAAHADLLAGYPSIACTRFDEGPQTTEHFRLIVGYDAATDEVIFHEPAEADGAYRRMPRARWMALWPLKYRDDRWTVIRLRLEPATLTEPPTFPFHTPADYAQHVRALRERLPDGFSVVVEPPFVVVGDEAPATVARRAAGTVRWAVAQLEAAYFARPPAQILDVWLFGGARSYEHHAQRLFERKPSTPYGYYSARDRALIMNIATGGGTLVHEIVHPYVEANFPACPAWFNEGLGSLYEQSAERGGRIVGLTNWRLDGLQRAIAAGRLGSIEALCKTTTGQFYDEDPGTHYAQARYLLYYLQEQDELRGYYAAFHAAHRDDPSGYATLVATLGERDMAAFQRRWERWVMGLRFSG